MGYFLRDFGVIRLENLNCFLNSCVNFQFNAIWHRWSAAALIFCTRLAESDITITPSVTWMDLLRWWYNHTAHVVSSSRSLAFLDNMTDKHKSTSPSAIQVENLRKIISSEDKLDVISRLEWGKQIFDICHNDKLAHSSICKFWVMLTELKKLLWQELKWLCSKTTTVLSKWTVPRTRISVSYIILH